MALEKSICHDPQIEGKAQHARRVAAWTKAIARARGVSSGEQLVLQNAALSHEFASILLNEPSWDRLLTDIGVQAAGPSSVSADARRVLAFLRGTNPSQEQIHETERLAAILDQADRFDEHFEIEPFLDPQAQPPADAMNALQAPHRSSIEDLKRCLPVLPKAAHAVFALLGKPSVDLEELNDVVRRDQVLAVNVIEASNSGLWGASQPVRNLRHAIARLGADNTKKVILASVLRPMFSSGSLNRSWRHAQDAAETAERIGSYTQIVAPPEAFLAGLVHDIGELRFHLAHRGSKTSAGGWWKRVARRESSSRSFLGRITPRPERNSCDHGDFQSSFAKRFSFITGRSARILRWPPCSTWWNSNSRPKKICHHWLDWNQLAVALTCHGQTVVLKGAIQSFGTESPNDPSFDSKTLARGLFAGRSVRLRRTRIAGIRIAAQQESRRSNFQISRAVAKISAGKRHVAETRLTSPEVDNWPSQPERNTV